MTDVTAQLCQISPGLLQWAGSGVVAALFLSGFGLGTRQGYRMGRQAQRDIDKLKARADRDERRAVPPFPPMWRCEACRGWNDASETSCDRCGTPRFPAA